jgi:hypothetical protein
VKAWNTTPLIRGLRSGTTRSKKPPGSCSATIATGGALNRSKILSSTVRPELAGRLASGDPCPKRSFHSSSRFEVSGLGSAPCFFSNRGFINGFVWRPGHSIPGCIYRRYPFESLSTSPLLSDVIQHKISTELRQTTNRRGHCPHKSLIINKIKSLQKILLV